MHRYMPFQQPFFSLWPPAISVEQVLVSESYLQEWKTPPLCHGKPLNYFPHLVTLQRIRPLRHIEVATVTSVLSLTTCAPKVAAIRSCVRALALSTDELTWRKVGNVPPDAIAWLPAVIGLVQNYKAIFWEVGSVLWRASFLRSTHKPSHIFAF